jgi:hypothetical protein
MQHVQCPACTSYGILGSAWHNKTDEVKHRTNKPEVPPAVRPDPTGDPGRFVHIYARLAVPCGGAIAGPIAPDAPKVAHETTKSLTVFKRTAFRSLDVATIRAGFVNKKEKRKYLYD